MGWIWASKSQTPPATPPGDSPRAPSLPSTTTHTSTPSDTTADPEIAKFLAFFQEDTIPKSKPARLPPPPSKPSSEPPLPQQPQQQGQQQDSSSWFSFTFPGGPKSVSIPSDLQSTPSLSSSTNTSSYHSSVTSPSSPTSVDPPAMPTSTFEDDSVEDPSLPPPAYASLASDMSCRNTFDHAFYCNGIGGQWTAVYRNGSLQSCSEKWGDFWFCMRTRSLSGKLREDSIRQYYREKEVAKYEGQPSSEDIWRPREHVVKEGVFLTHPIPKTDQADAEWNRQEIEKRKKIRDQLGLGPEQGTHELSIKKGS